MKTRIIYNPRSGDLTRKPALLTLAQRWVSDHRPETTIVPTERGGHATELARQAVADGCGIIMAFGGDGTMNEVAQALLGTQATLALLPCGSGNGLARHLGIPLDPAAALSLLLTGRPRTIDAGLADSRPFFVVAGLGFEAVIARRFSSLTNRGLAGYIRTGVRTWWGYAPQDYAITHSGESPHTHRAFTLAVANSSQYGNNARIAPAAEVDDGLLDLTAVPPITVLNATPLLLALFRGTLARQSSVPQLRAEKFTVERSTPGPLHTDGETHEAGTRVEFTVRPRCLRVLVPS
ncbi:MAG: diacylglycerol kinase family protein [Verrucomicrobiota bacterium]